MPFKLKQGIKDEIRRGILDGSFPPGSALPSIRSLARSFKVSKLTMQRTIGELKADGLLESYIGKGVFVRAGRGSCAGGRSRVAFFSHYDVEKTLRSGDYPFRALSALRSALRRSGVVLSGLGAAGLDGAGIRNAVHAGGFSGIVIFEVNNSHLIAELQKTMLPMVSMDYDATHLGISSVIHDNLWGAYSAARHLVERGHREVVVFGRPRLCGPGSNNFVDTVDRERLDGCRLALRSAGIDFQKVELPEDKLESRALLKEIFSRRRRPSAVLSCHNYLTVRILAELERMGYSIPEDVEIVDFDGGGFEFSKGMRLSSVSMNHEELGSKAAEFMAALLGGGEKGAPFFHQVGTELQINQSSAKRRIAS